MISEIFNNALKELKQSKQKNESDEIIALRLKELYACWGILVDNGNSIEDFGQFRLWEQAINSAVNAPDDNVNTYLAKTDPNQQHSRYACREEKNNLRKSLISLNKLIKTLSPFDINNAENLYEIAGGGEQVDAVPDDGIYDLYDAVADDSQSEGVDGGLYAKVLGKASANSSDDDSGCAMSSPDESENGYLTPINANAIVNSNPKADFSYAIYFVKNATSFNASARNHSEINPFFLRRIAKFFSDTVNCAKAIMKPQISDINPRYSAVSFVTIDDNLLADLRQLQKVLKQINEQAMNFTERYSKIQKEAALEFAESRAIELLFNAVANEEAEYYLEEQHKQYLYPEELKNIFKKSCAGTFNNENRGRARKFGLDNLAAAISNIKENTDNKSKLIVKFTAENKKYKLDLQKTTEEKNIEVLLPEEFENFYNKIKKARSQAPSHATELLIHFLCDRNGQVRPEEDVSFGEKRVVKETLVGEKIFSLMVVKISILELLAKDTNRLSVEINKNESGQYAFRLKASEVVILEELLPKSGVKFLETTVPQAVLKEQPKEVVNSAASSSQILKSKTNKGVKILKSLANKVRPRSKSESATKQKKPVTNKKRTISDSACGGVTPIEAECEAGMYEVIDKGSQKPLPPLPSFFSAASKLLRTVSDSVPSTAQAQQDLAAPPLPPRRLTR